jgi:hypothetical protein
MDDAIEVLRAVVARSSKGIQVGAEIRLALWEACQSENDIGRSQNMNAALRMIEMQRARLGNPIPL